MSQETSGRRRTTKINILNQQVSRYNGVIAAKRADDRCVIADAGYQR
jgi:hypothetical protein